MISSKPIIVIRGLGVRRSGAQILRDIDWEVVDEENWVILGANGSGKTSLLSCVTGYVTPSEGTIQVLDRQYGKSDCRELRREIGLVSSSIRQWIEDRQTALDIVASGRDAELNLWRPATGTLKQEALSVLEQIECLALAHRPWMFLSQGERQRVLIGRALVASHRVLILDEPCAGLDPVAREKFLSFLDRLTRAEITPNLVFVTHHVEEILPCFDKALVIRNGATLAKGTIGEVISSGVLSDAFGAEIKVRKSYRRYSLQFGTLNPGYSVELDQS